MLTTVNTQAHLAKINAKFVRGAEAYLENLGEPLLSSRSKEQHLVAVVEQDLGRRAWVAPEGDSLEWEDEVVDVGPGPSLRRRAEESSAADKVFAGFRGGRIHGAPQPVPASPPDDEASSDLDKRTLNPKWQTEKSSKATIPCVRTTQCSGMTMPANSHAWCNPSTKTCTWRECHSLIRKRCCWLSKFFFPAVCDSGYTANPWTRTCSKNKGKASTSPKMSSSSKATPSGASQAPVAVSQTAAKSTKTDSTKASYVFVCLGSSSEIH